MKNKIKPKHKREQSPFISKVLTKKQTLYIYKREITIKYTEAIRADIKKLMKEKGIGWKKLSLLLKNSGFNYNPTAIQIYVNMYKKNNAMDINYFVPIIIVLDEIKPYF